MENERYLPIPGFESYMVSDLGNVKRIAPWSDGRKRKIGILSPSRKYGKRTTNNYLRYTLRDNAGKPTWHQAHRLVLLVFVGPPPDSWSQSNHKNGDKEDNRLENLEWCSPSQNQLHKYRVLNAPTRPGSKHHNAKVTEDDVFAIRALRKKGWTLPQLAKEFGLSRPTICWIAKRKSWKHI